MTTISGSTSLLDDLERAAQQMLVAAKVFDMGSYGWLNENDADPDYIGHAMWQTDQPYVDFNAILGGGPVRQRPPEAEKQILTLGEDFSGLMQASRLSIGLTLLWKPQALRNVLNESPFFWLHHTDAYLKLAIASDRLRDFLIVACTGGSPDNYKQTRQRKRYITPFNDARALLAGRNIDTSQLEPSLSALPDLANAIYAFIDRRNNIVHAIATRMAKSVRDSVTELQRRHDHPEIHDVTPHRFDLETLKQQMASANEKLEKELSDATQELVNWYQILIEVSNHVFQIDYWSRVSATREETT